MKVYNQGDALPEGHKWYRKKTMVRLVEMNEPFLCSSREGDLQGNPGDFLAEDGHGGFYPISAEFHRNNYEEVEEDKT